MRVLGVIGLVMAIGGFAACGGTGIAGDDDTEWGQGSVLINEVVAYPVNDWSQSSGSGMPYQGTPGTGTVSSLDEFVEITNTGTAPVDLSGWTLEIVGGETTVTEIGVQGTLVLSSGSRLDALQPGGFLVIGNPEGSLSTDCYIALYDQNGTFMDDVEIGGLNEERDREDDGVGDGAPGPGENGFARGTFDEAIARPVGATDTGNDQADFAKMKATPLAANTPWAVPEESIPPAVLGSASGSSFKATDLLWIEFDEPVAPDSTESSITVTVDGREIALGFTTFEDNDRTIVINPIGRLPFDKELSVLVRGGPDGVTDRAGNPLLVDYSFTVRTESGPTDPSPVRINEICASPLQDWSDSSGGDDIAFSGIPGTGTVSSLDEWVELLVAQPGSTDLSQYSLLIYNGPNIYGPTRTVTPMTSNIPTIRIEGESGDIGTLSQGDRVTIGNPIGTIHNDAYLVLRNGSGQIVDAVEIGGLSYETDRAGDGIDNGAPGPGANGGSTEARDEVIARIPDGADTGDDVADFEHSVATPGAPNN